MTSRERKLARAIDSVTFFPGTATKRFAIAMKFAAEVPEPGPELTEKQRKYLIDTAIRFRRQLNPLMVQMAEQMRAEREQ